MQTSRVRRTIQAILAGMGIAVTAWILYLVATESLSKHHVPRILHDFFAGLGLALH